MMSTCTTIGRAVLIAVLGITVLGWVPPGSAQSNVTLATPGENMGAEPKAAAKPVIVIETSMGTIKAELWPDKAPATVASFLAYIKDGYYAGTIFHRVIDGFMIQGGGFTADMRQKSTKAPVRNEARSDTPNARGTLAMARTSVVDSATSQFFINLVDNGFLNHQNETPAGFGYCVFGKVTSGQDVVDAIGKVATAAQDVPRQTVEIKSITLE